LALAVPLSRFTSQVGGGSAFYVRPHPNMDTPTTPKTTSFSHRAAKLGWVCPVISLIVFALLIFDRQIVARKIIPIIVQVALLLIVVGLIFGIVALFGVSKHGTKGILVPAIVGIIISGLLILFCVIVA
jgi:uncharacterized membrane protein YsdA (DUF1294 family)